MMNNAIAIPTDIFFLCTACGEFHLAADTVWVQDEDEDTGWVSAEYPVCRTCLDAA